MGVAAAAGKVGGADLEFDALVSPAFQPCPRRWVEAVAKEGEEDQQTLEDELAVGEDVAWFGLERLWRTDARNPDPVVVLPCLAWSILR